MKNIGKGIGGALLSLAFVFGIVFTATSSTAQAQYRDRYYQRRDRDNDRWDRNRDWRRRQNRDWRRNRDWNRNNGAYYDPYRRNNGYGNYGGYNQVELNRGFQQGLNTGSSDARRGQSYNPQRSRYFRNPSSQAFRQGFVRGYDQGYRQYSRYGYQRSYPGYGSSNSGWGAILGGILGRP